MQTRLVRIRSSMDADFPAYLALFTAYEEEIGLNPAGSREKLLRRVDREGAQDLHALLLAEETPAGFVHAHPEARRAGSTAFTWLPPSAAGVWAAAWPLMGKLGSGPPEPGRFC